MAKKRHKAKSLKSLRAKLDQVFSLYIRWRDTTPNGRGTCISCGEVTTLQCGHFIKRQHLMTRWNDHNAAGQCVRCNHYLGGNEGAFSLALVKKYGLAEVEHLLTLKHLPARFSRIALEGMISDYESRIAVLD